MMKYTREEAASLVGIGFCQPKFYKRSVWQKAKRLMDNVVCPNRLARPYDYGRGKGKYESDMEIDVVKKHTIEILAKKGLILESNEAE